MKSKVDTVHDFRTNILLRTEDMCVVLREATNTRQSVQRTREFGPVTRSELGVAKTADADTIRRAYRKLAKDLHPDRNPGDKASEDRFKRINAAFDILGDAQKREKYDRGEIDADGHETHRGFGGGGPFNGGGRHYENVDFDDILGQMFGGGGNRSNGNVHGGPPRGMRPGGGGGRPPQGNMPQRMTGRRHGPGGRKRSK